MRGTMLLALLALMIVPAASAGPVADPCNGDCVSQDVGVGPDGAHASVHHGLGFGGGVDVVVTDDGQFYVGYSEGISRCWVSSYGVGCVF